MFLKSTRFSNKEKERMKEREKELREKEGRYTNGHLFNSISVSGMTMCYACNKSITAKEALICPTCNVTIHNRCKDVLPNCTKVKQKQQKIALVKSTSALQTVALRSKGSIRERPSSAIYPSESFRQGFLSSRKPRTPLSLSKSVSTTNIAGNFNDDSPLGLRKMLSQSTDSLNMRNRTLSVESLIDEGAEVIYNHLMGNLEADEKDFEADSWSLAVDTNFLQQHRKDVMKRQDVIYELIQTEVHHVRTLKIMSDIFRKGMLEDLQMDSQLVHNMFPSLDELLDIHVQFLTRLLDRRKESLAIESNKNFVINRLGDILMNQFSGETAEHMKRAYSEFCSRHTKAVKLYKELYARDKKFQHFIRKATRSSVLRRHGVQECILLVTQRLTKYPVLIDRILQNTKEDGNEFQDLGQSLIMLKELIQAVDQEVHDCEQNWRLQEIYNRIDNKTEAVVTGKLIFRKEELQRRKLIHDGYMQLKTTTGRFKDVRVLLMTDVLILLQEKDQRYTFVSVDKTAVIPLQNLIVRDVANQERGMFLISATTPPEMHELYSMSREERSTWVKHIQLTVSMCPRKEDFPLVETEVEVCLRKIKDEILQKDREILELLEEKTSLFNDILRMQTIEETNFCLKPRNLFRADSLDAPKGEKLLNGAIHEVESLKNILTGSGLDLLQLYMERDQNHCPNNDSADTISLNTTDGDDQSLNGSTDFCRMNSDTVQRDRNGNQLQQKSPQEEVFQKLVNLYGLLHGLQAAVVQQDTIIELRLQEISERREKLTRSNSKDSNMVDMRTMSVDKQGTELTLLQRQHSLLQEELRRCRKTCEERAVEIQALEEKLQESERGRVQLQKELEMLKELNSISQQSVLARKKKSFQERRRSLPSGDFLTTLSSQQDMSHRRGSEDDGISLSHLHSTRLNSDSIADEDSEHGVPQISPEESDPELHSEEEECDGQIMSTSGSREYQRMQDIPEEIEGTQEARPGDPATEDSQ
ncbi:rho guanine nucleotide exchange factor 2 isoform X2 [Protopterus annectens]|uniref:rho guanine nucleotide exchange factor 2 isoform X2 n=1 Tax=Protopterus annectens TaxID=7888 RepID=UPI001CFB321B|nr:rho guanine nucleotide exchange factor 2 isoform X2 [Protopterus annectens]